jgi:hypothetical protein
MKSDETNPAVTRAKVELVEVTDASGHRAKTTLTQPDAVGATWKAGGCTLVNVHITFFEDGTGTFTSFFEGGDGDVWIIYALWPEPGPNGPRFPPVTDGNGNTKFDSDSNTGLGIPFGFGFVYDPRWFSRIKWVHAENHC